MRHAGIFAVALYVGLTTASGRYFFIYSGLHAIDAASLLNQLQMSKSLIAFNYCFLIIALAARPRAHVSLINAGLILITGAGT